ncbi:MAG: phosphatidylglycerol lysyltransferase domain-containing protein [Mycobacteriales bacterium]
MSTTGNRDVRAWWTQSSRRTPGFLALLTFLLGLTTLISALLPAQRSRVRLLSNVVPKPAPTTATATAVAAALGVLLLLLAKGLRRRKRRAWRAAIVFTLLLVFLHVLKGFDVEEAAASLIVLVLLWHGRKEFYAVGDPVGRFLAVRYFVGLLFTGMASGMVMLTVSYHHLEGEPSVWQMVQDSAAGLVGLPGPLTFRGDRMEDVYAFTLAGLGLLTAFVTAYLALRPSEPPPHLAGDDEGRLRELLDKWGKRDSLGYFALRRDKNVLWSPTGKAAILYRVVAGVALASGDPIGDPEAWPGAIEPFLEQARMHAWVPAVMGCSEQGGTVWSRFGLDVLELGDEAVVECSAFTLDGRAMRGVRQACGRVERAGYVATVRRTRDIPPEEVAELLHAADRWRGEETERGFSMALGRLGDPADGDCVVVTAHKDGQLRALLHFAPWGRDGLSLDLMRRDRESDNGLNEFLIVKLIQGAKELGVDRVSLNFAVFRSALERGERLGAGPIIRMWSKLLVFASRWWQIESLYRFNAKFRPEWHPRYIAYPQTRDLPRIGLAALEAEAFFVRPRLFRRLVGCPPHPAADYGAEPASTSTTSASETGEKSA